METTFGAVRLPSKKKEEKKSWKSVLEFVANIYEQYY